MYARVGLTDHPWAFAAKAKATAATSMQIALVPALRDLRHINY
ncbi:hypothetical protein [Streptomyces sp. S3(2020)]|nr:hypothetical protein [Streptomyces sp. S3(2020)]